MANNYQLAIIHKLYHYINNIMANIKPNQDISIVNIPIFNTIFLTLKNINTHKIIILKAILAPILAMVFIVFSLSKIIHNFPSIAANTFYNTIFIVLITFITLYFSTILSVNLYRTSLNEEENFNILNVKGLKWRKIHINFIKKLTVMFLKIFFMVLIASVAISGFSHFVKIPDILIKAVVQFGLFLFLAKDIMILPAIATNKGTENEHDEKLNLFTKNNSLRLYAIFFAIPSLFYMLINSYIIQYFSQHNNISSSVLVISQLLFLIVYIYQIFAISACYSFF